LAVLILQEGPGQKNQLEIGKMRRTSEGQLTPSTPAIIPEKP